MTTPLVSPSLTVYNGGMRTFRSTLLVAMVAGVVALSSLDVLFAIFRPPVLTGRPAGATPTPYSHCIVASYGTGAHENGELCRAHRSGSPIVILVHGGAWYGVGFGDPGVPTEAAYLVAHGAAVFAIDYQFPSPAIPAEVADVVKATNYAKAVAGRIGGNPHSVVLFGGSAGGNLVELAASQVAVKGVVDLSGPADLATFIRQPSFSASNVLALEWAFGCAPLATCSTASLTAWSPASNPPPRSVRQFIGQAVGDTTVYPCQGQDIATATGSVVHWVQGSAHAFDLDPTLNPAIAQFIGGGR